jgi:predicted AlkP superfamily pyrophosphatase or phosphodiesterase
VRPTHHPVRPAGLTAPGAVVLSLLAAVVLLLAPGFALFAQAERPLVILISLDGFRWDYMSKAATPNLRSLAARGVRAEGLIPSFPTKTFPNHYTIVTGLYPGHHGIIANNLLDPATGRTFAMSKRDEVRDPMWWGGEPIWVTAQRAGLLAAPMFWPGSEAPIGGTLPTYWKAYNEGMSGTARVDQVLQWIDLPAARRPSFLTLYFEDTDTAGHNAGPDSDLVRRALVRVDGFVGRLLRGLERRKLTAKANIVVLSDHGMAAVAPENVVRLSDHISLSDVEIADINPTLGVFPKEGREDAVFKALASASPRLKVYRRAETPESWHYRDHPRIPPIVGVMDEGWTVIAGTVADAVARAKPFRGSHGYEATFRSMHGIFIAAGPAFQTGVTVPAFENINVYGAMAAALNLTPARNDGDPAVAKQLLR